MCQEEKQQQYACQWLKRHVRHSTGGVLSLIKKRPLITSPKSVFLLISVPAYLSHAVVQLTQQHASAFTFSCLSCKGKVTPHRLPETCMQARLNKWFGNFRPAGAHFDLCLSCGGWRLVFTSTSWILINGQSASWIMQTFGYAVVWYGQKTGYMLIAWQATKCKLKKANYDRLMMETPGQSTSMMITCGSMINNSSFSLSQLAFSKETQLNLSMWCIFLIKNEGWKVIQIIEWQCLRHKFSLRIFMITQRQKHCKNVRTA